jgi:hypothetical protein
LQLARGRSVNALDDDLVRRRQLLVLLDAPSRHRNRANHGKDRQTRLTGSDHTIRFLIRDSAGQFVVAFDEVFRSVGTTAPSSGTAPPRTAPARLRRALQHPPAPPRPRPTRTRHSRRRRVPARPTNPATPHLQRTHQRVPPSSLNTPTTASQSHTRQLRRARSPPTRRRQHRRRLPSTRTRFRHPQGARQGSGEAASPRRARPSPALGADCSGGSRQRGR